jgi:hypothetical protein
MSKMTKKTGGPYMQQAGRGNMEKTGAGIPVELMGPAMHEDGHDGPVPINRMNAGQGVSRPSGFYEARYDSGKNPNAETPLIGPKPLINSDTGDEYKHRFQSASTASTSLDKLGVFQNQTVTPKSQLKSINNVKNPKPLPQETFAKGKLIYSNPEAKPEHLMTNFSSLAYGDSRIQRAASDAGFPNINNVNQNDIQNTIRTNQEVAPNGQKRVYRPTSKVQGAFDFADRLYDTHIQDSIGISDFNRIKRANDLKASKTQKFNKTLTAQALNGWTNNGPNMKKKK